MNPKLIVEQKITAFVNKYAVYTADQAGTKSALVAFAQQKRLTFKEQVIFYGDEAKTQPIFTLRAEKILDVHGKFVIDDMEGNRIGAFRKEFKASLLKSTWSILDTNDQSKLTITESSMALAVFRRFAGFLPIVGDLAEIISWFFKYHFAFINGANQEVGQYRKTTLFRDHYALSMTDDYYASEDWRVLAAVAVALDALQSR
ncbi:MAG: hypothetical protein JWM07_85 [Candidatus Saccharibacteria bacterium]|nr:hypothetical protein [Candidatus Saccharibacteria bacterium]